jgi:tetratricopeptide (TPR) repeat protein
VSPRTRVRLLAGAAALAAAGVAVGATLIGRESGSSPEPAAERDPPALELGIALRDDRQARDLRAAERSYDRGDASAARKRFAALLTRDPASVEAAVGVAVASWPNGTLPRLRALAEREPESGLVRLHYGLALYAAGNDAAATAQWREALRADPDTSAALRAEDLLHPEMAPGRPFFYPSYQAPPALRELSPPDQLAALEQRARAGGARANLLYGAMLQRSGRAASAAAAFGRALELEPENLGARVAHAVGRFTKANPAAAFSRLGPLTRDHRNAAILRFHLGLVLLWIRDVEDAMAQLEQAVAADRRGFYGRESRKLLSRLEDIRT